MKEIKHETKILKLKSVAKNKDRDVVEGFSVSRFPEIIRTKYIRNHDYSIVSTKVEINANSEYYNLTALIEVVIHYEGDMVRSSPATRNKINMRLDYLAQKTCAEHFYSQWQESK